MVKSKFFAISTASMVIAGSVSSFFACGLSAFSGGAQAWAYPQVFSCSALSSHNLTKHGLPEIKNITSHSATVCSGTYRNADFIISSVKTRQVSKIKSSIKFNQSHYRAADYDVLTTAPTNQGCSEVIINDPQLITVTTPHCALTHKIVSAVVQVLKESQAK